MLLEKRIQAFVQLGAYLTDKKFLNTPFLDQVERRNPWYTRQNVVLQTQAIATNLSEENLRRWLKEVPDELVDKTVGLILAGNLPLVGFHDIMCVLLAGFRSRVKTSSEDAGLTHHLLETLIQIEPDFADRIDLVEQLKEFDLIIATGSDNSARYFDYYFGKYPHIIRKNRNSIAVLSGHEGDEDLKGLGHDVLDYFGLGCRSVSKLYLPRDYSVPELLSALESFAPIADHTKYRNNYDFNKSIYLINKEPHYDNGFLLLRENVELASPLSVLHYEYYDDLNQVRASIKSQSDQIQLVASNLSLDLDGIPQFALGRSQCPALDDYADNVDTLAFLLENQ